MKTLTRRRFLKLATRAAASTSLSPLVFGSRAGAQVNLASDIGTGVDGDNLVIGMSGDFSSPRAGASIEYYRGSRAVLEEVNEQGGIHGKRLQLIALDDSGVPNVAISNTFRLLEVEQAFCLANYVGDETVARVLPVVHTYRDANLRMVGNLSGALIQRRLPYVEQVYNVRASTLQETAQLANNSWDAGRRNIGLFYTADAGGRVGQAGVARALAAKDATITAEATHNAALTDQAQGVIGRTGRADDQVSSQELAISALRDETSAAVRYLRSNNCDSVICSTDPQTFQYFVAAARDSDWDVPIAGTSLSDSTPQDLIDLENARGVVAGLYTRAVYSSQVLPYFRNRNWPGVNLYHQLMTKWNPEAPTGSRADYSPRLASSGLEGSINTRVLVAGLRLAGPELSRARFDQSLASLAELDLGINAPVSFADGDRQGLKQIYYTSIAGNSWEALEGIVSALSS